jgi:hypothetical protein
MAQSGERAATDAVAEQAADIATEVTEGREAHEAREAQRWRRLAVPFEAAARSGARVTGRGVRAARRGAETARRGADTARRSASTARRGAGTARQGIGAGTGWLSGQVVAMAPRLRVRDQAALRAQFPGLDADAMADRLIEGAARASATVGGAVGAWAALPVLPAFPAEMVTEMLALVGIEIKLVAELHEAYGTPAPGGGTERMTAYLAAWAHRRGVSMIPGGLVLAAGSPLARRLRWRLAARAGRTAFSLAPLFTGAAAGALLNRRETRRLGQEIQADLRHRLP